MMIIIDRNNLPKVPNRFACPICGKGLIIEINEWETETGKVTPTGLSITCETRPVDNERQFYGWLEEHYQMPYVDWLPVEILVYQWFDQNYRMK
jgi:hypothetical protein